MQNLQISSEEFYRNGIFASRKKVLSFMRELGTNQQSQKWSDDLTDNHIGQKGTRTMLYNRNKRSYFNYKIDKIDTRSQDLRKKFFLYF